jgi:PAS domain S-box-containing protein
LAYLLVAALAAAVGWFARKRKDTLQLQRETARQMTIESSRHMAVLESMSDAVISIDAQQRIVLFNPAAERLLGCPAASALGSSVQRFIPPEFRARHDDQITEFIRTGVAQITSGHSRELVALRSDGTRVQVEAMLSKVVDTGASGEQRLYTVILHDITARKATQEQLHRLQERYRIMVEQSPDAICVAEGSRVALVNRACSNLFGARDPSDVVGQDLTRFFPGGDNAALRDWLGDARPGQQALNREQRIARLDGEQRDVEISIAHVPDHGGVATQLVMRDITERKRATDELLRSREELRRLSAGLTSAREAERRAVSRELHDELGQRLSAIKMGLSLALTQAASEPALDAQLRELAREVDATVGSVRRIASDLRPTMLDDLGLDAAIEWLAADWSRRTGIGIELDCEPVDAALSDAAKTSVYRIVQEALTNIVRHAQASRVWIAMHREGANLELRVADNGTGLAPGAVDKHDSHGLMGIRERARLLGGVASIRNLPDTGCALLVTLPLARVDSRPGTLQEALP